MEVAIPKARDFEFGSSATASPYASMPPSPARLGEHFFISAPASPSRMSELYLSPPPPELNDDDDFAFEFREDLERTSLSADELFDGGVIRPLQAIPNAERGREREKQTDRRATRSLSPPKRHGQIVVVSKPSSSSSSSSTTVNKSKKWRLRDFLLFRSASEGRAADKDPLRKYCYGNGKKKSFVSAHELHYTVNKAVSEDLKKKTFLPYKQGILGRLAFNPALHALANGFGSFTRASAST